MMRHMKEISASTQNWQQWGSLPVCVKSDLWILKRLTSASHPLFISFLWTNFAFHKAKGLIHLQEFAEKPGEAEPISNLRTLKAGAGGPRFKVSLSYIGKSYSHLTKKGNNTNSISSQWWATENLAGRLINLCLLVCICAAKNQTQKQTVGKCSTTELNQQPLMSP